MESTGQRNLHESKTVETKVENPDQYTDSKKHILSGYIFGDQAEKVGEIVSETVMDRATRQLVRKKEIFDMTAVIYLNQTAMETAASMGHWRCVEAIVDNRSSDLEDKARYTSALFYLIHANEIEDAFRNQLIFKLLHCHCDLTRVNENGKTPGDIAIELERWSTLGVIIAYEKGEKGPEIHARLIRSLFEKILKKPVVDIQPAGEPHLHRIEIHWIEKILLKKVLKTCPENTTDTLLDLAVQVGDVKLIEEFLARGFSPGVMDLVTEVNPVVDVLNHVYFYSLARREMLFMCYIQALRDRNNNFRRLEGVPPALFISHILPFLTRLTIGNVDDEQANHIIITREKIIKNIYVKKVMKDFFAEYDKKYSFSHSSETKKFVADLKRILFLDEIDCARQIGKRALRFVNANVGKKPGTVTLVTQFGLLRFLPSEEENKNDRVVPVPVIAPPNRLG